MAKNKVINILFCGIGGQGVLKASELCAWAAIKEGFHVKKSEIHGMAQRGGSVESHLRFGTYVFSPLIPEGKADFIMAFHPNEHERTLNYLKPHGKDFLSYLEKAQSVLENKRYLNTFMIGVLSKYLLIKEVNWISAIKTIFSDKYIQENQKVFLKGRKIVNINKEGAYDLE